MRESNRRAPQVSPRSSLEAFPRSGLLFLSAFRSKIGQQCCMRIAGRASAYSGAPRRERVSALFRQVYSTYERRVKQLGTEAD
jgi:hypothetical protein